MMDLIRNLAGDIKEVKRPVPNKEYTKLLQK